MFVKDTMNNVGRYASLRDGRKEGRVWRVMTRVAGDRYLVRNGVTGEYRTIHAWLDVASLY